ncbi:hypothetical protein EDC01DRAFT_630847 [Geopyxis carbonaria]|nr:hypothetical protein EDC01DRAFT_630847 [Geopyxis carbonaria]
MAAEQKQSPGGYNQPHTSIQQQQSPGGYNQPQPLTQQYQSPGGYNQPQPLALQHQSPGGYNQSSAQPLYNGQTGTAQYQYAQNGQIGTSTQQYPHGTQYHAELPGSNVNYKPKPSADPATLFNILKETVVENSLENIYSDDKLHELARGIATKDPVTEICQRWKIPLEIGLDLTKLALYDIVLLLDDSGSVKFNRLIPDLKFILSAVAFASGLFDQDGFSIRFLNSDLKFDNVKSEEQTCGLEGVSFSGVTPFAGALKNKILDPFVYGKNLRKPLLVIMITDGEPTDNDEKHFERHIEDVKKHFGGRGMVAFQIAQIGNDLDAQAFLASLDTDPVIGSLIDCTSNFELEAAEFKKDPNSGENSLTIELWYTKLLLGSIDLTYDNRDEGKPNRKKPVYTAPVSVSPNPGSVPSQGFPSQGYSHQQNGQYGQPPTTQNIQAIHGFPPGGTQPGYAQGQQQQGYAQYSQQPYMPSTQGSQSFPPGGASQGHSQGQVQQSYGQQSYGQQSYGQHGQSPNNQGIQSYRPPSGGTSPSPSPQPSMYGGPFQPQQGYNIPNQQHLQPPGSAAPNYSNPHYPQQSSQAPQGYQPYQQPQPSSPSGSYNGQPPPAQYTPNAAYAPQQR